MTCQLPSRILPIKPDSVSPISWYIDINFLMFKSTLGLISHYILVLTYTVMRVPAPKWLSVPIYWFLLTTAWYFSMNYHFVCCFAYFRHVFLFSVAISVFVYARYYIRPNPIRCHWYTVIRYPTSTVFNWCEPDSVCRTFKMATWSWIKKGVYLLWI